MVKGQCAAGWGGGSPLEVCRPPRKIIRAHRGWLLLFLLAARWCKMFLHRNSLCINA